MALFWPAPIPLVPGVGVYHWIVYYHLAHPTVQRAYMDSEQGLVVVFDWPVKQVDEMASNDALNTDNWTVARDDGSPVPPVLTVQPVSDRRVRLRFTRSPATWLQGATVVPSASITDPSGTIGVTP